MLSSLIGIVQGVAARHRRSARISPLSIEVQDRLAGGSIPDLIGDNTPRLCGAYRLNPRMLSGNFADSRSILALQRMGV
jgi:hypothetical protein